MKLTLPWPPSINNYWLHKRTGQTYLAKAGREYRERVQIAAMGEPGPLKGRLFVKVEAYPPDRRQRDIDNILKALLDALEHSGVYVNDNQIDRLHVERREVISGGGVYVTIEKLERTK